MPVESRNRLESGKTCRFPSAYAQTKLLKRISKSKTKMCSRILQPFLIRNVAHLKARFIASFSVFLGANISGGYHNTQICCGWVPVTADTSCMTFPVTGNGPAERASHMIELGDNSQLFHIAPAPVH